MSPLVLGVLAVLGGSSGAFAGPFEDVLRGSAVAAYDAAPVSPRYVPGSPIKMRWEGLYAGAHIGRSAATLNFGNSVSSLLDYILRDDLVLNTVSGWTTLGATDSAAVSFGGFVGYNMQWEEAVVGIEASYNRAGKDGISGSASDSMTRIFNDDSGAPSGHHFFYTTTVAGSASARLTDFGTLRVRTGYAIDKFLPYAFGGLAIGRVDISRSASVGYLRQDIPDTGTTALADYTFTTTTRSEDQKGVIGYGFTAGLGIDIAIMPNLLARAEWEYIQFSPIKDFQIRINTVRGGLAWKF